MVIHLKTPPYFGVSVVDAGAVVVAGTDVGFAAGAVVAVVGFGVAVGAAHAARIELNKSATITQPHIIFFIIYLILSGNLFLLLISLCVKYVN